jgi:hypothetical protein
MIYNYLLININYMISILKYLFYYIYLFSYDMNVLGIYENKMFPMIGTTQLTSSMDKLS